MASFKDIIGQENIKEHMQNAIRMDKVSHAYIIQGELGAGKEFIAKVFAKTVLPVPGTSSIKMCPPQSREMRARSTTCFLPRIAFWLLSFIITAISFTL